MDPTKPLEGEELTKALAEWHEVWKELYPSAEFDVSKEARFLKKVSKHRQEITKKWMDDRALWEGIDRHTIRMVLTHLSRSVERYRKLGADLTGYRKELIDAARDAVDLDRWRIMKLTSEDQSDIWSYEGEQDGQDKEE